MNIVKIAAAAFILSLCQAITIGNEVCIDETQGCAHYNSSICKSSLGYNGSRAETVKGLKCQSWASKYPHNHTHLDQPSNYCRNPDVAPAPWCYTTNNATRWDFCFKPCVTVCVDEAQGCAHYNSSICKSSLAYNGSRAETVKGLKCQSWASKYPHNHTHLDQPSNYCRNPDVAPAPWCYTTNNATRWDFCFKPCVTVCVDEAQGCAHYNSSICKSSLAYNGSRAETVKGLKCQSWASKYPHNHTHLDQPSNYCRNPDVAPAPWCYTTNNATRWDFCFKPCGFEAPTDVKPHKIRLR